MRGGQHLQNRPAKCLGGGDAETAGESPRSQRHLPRRMDSGLWLSASKKKASHACAHPLLCTHAQVHIYTHTHTGHTNEETLLGPTPTPTQSAFRHRKPNGSLQSDSGLQAGDWTRCSNKGILNTCFFFQLKLQNTSSPPPSPQLCCQKASSALTCIITLGSLSVPLRPLLSPVLFSREQSE